MHRYEDYPVVEAQPWLDRPDALAQIEARVTAGEITNEQAEVLRHWQRDGYVILPQVLSRDIAERINADVQAIFDANQHLPIHELKMKFQDIFPGSAATRQAMCLPAVFEWLDLIFGTRALPYQTLNLPLSSQQAAHSDAILMTTNPPGFLAAVWFALEDVSEDCGPLVVYPGSHRANYVSAERVGIQRDADEAGCAEVYDRNYYRLIQEEVDRHGFMPKPFLPKQGDILIWHSNLIHGAQPITRQGATRKSLIAHYFAEGVEYYSDLFHKGCVLPGLR